MHFFFLAQDEYIVLSLRVFKNEQSKDYLLFYIFYAISSFPFDSVDSVLIHFVGMAGLIKLMPNENILKPINMQKFRLINDYIYYNLEVGTQCIQ